MSINYNCIDKNISGDALNLAHGFQPQTVTAKELLGHVMNGRAYCAELKPGSPRRNENFVATDLLSVDIDEGMTLDEAVNNRLVKDAATFIYQTVNHTEESHRFRIGFALARTITDPKEMRAATRSLVARLAGDPSAVDPARMFFGNRNAEPVYLEGGISEDLLKELIDQSVEAHQTDTIAGRSASTRSQRLFPVDDIFTSPKGRSGTIDTFSRSDPLYCPYHRDRRASAFVIQNQNGQKGIHCSKCAQSFWRTGYNDHFDFTSFVTALKATKRIATPLEGIDRFLEGPDDENFISTAEIHFENTQYLDSVAFRPGVTFIRSPKGSGKTRLLASLVAQQPTKRVLLIGHRRSLIRSMCNTLEIDCYLDAGSSRPQSRYGICLDSLMGIKTDKPYDYVLLDEVEQVLSHFLSDTMRDRRLHVIHRLSHLVSSAKHVIALDADLSWNSFRRLCEWREDSPVASQNSVIVNEYIRDRGPIHVVSSAKQLIGEIKKAARDDKRCFVTSNSRESIERIYAALMKENPSLQAIAVHSGTVHEQAVDAFLKDPKGQSLQYRMVLASPSLGTGVDFSFDDDRDRFDIVFGLFEPLVVTHFDCDQQLARVRNPREVRVFVNPAKFAFETDIDAVTADALSYEMMGHLIKGYNPDGEVQYHDHRDRDPLLRVAAGVLSLQRASKNHLKDNFLEHVRSQGWTIRAVEPDDDAKAEGTLLWAIGGKISEERATERLMNARNLTNQEVHKFQEEVRNEQKLSDPDRDAYTRALIENFYGCPITPALIKDDDYGALRKRVMLFEHLLAASSLGEFDRVLAEQALDEGQSTYLLKRRAYKEFMLVAMLELVPCFHERRFNLDCEFSNDDLGPFAAFVRRHCVAFETQFDRPVRSDLEAKPMSQLKAVLRFVGLDTVNSKNQVASGKKSYFYKLDPKRYQKMMDIVRLRNTA